MELKQLKYFLQIYEDGSFTAAAANLFITQQGLSVSISRLEEELGCKLFDRSSRQLKLTGDGRYLLEKAKNIVTCSNEVSDHFNELYHQHQVLNIASGVEILGLVPLQIQKILQNRDSNYVVEMHNAPGRRCEAFLDQGICSMGFICGPIDMKKYHAHLLQKRDYTYLVNCAHPLANRKTLCLDDFKNQQIILPGPESKIYHEFADLCEKNGFKANIALELDRQTVTYNIIKRDPSYIGQFLDYYTENLNDPLVRVLKMEGEELQWQLYLIWRKDHALSKGERTFIQLVLDSFSSGETVK